MTSQTFYWHDYETFGRSPQRDRPAQFAGIRTDMDFNIIGAPLMVYCKPANDFLPEPGACLLTGITPQICLEKGLCEADFISRIHAEFSQPGTCGLGYNSLRFDDEVTRNTLYRNLFDPYTREYQNGNSRWDLIDMVRLTYALRPEGFEWPLREDGKPSFRLEHLTAANGIVQEGAHDALVDVKATIELAKLIKTRQPRLYQWVFDNRGKTAVANLLDLHEQKPVLHTSRMFPAEYGCTTMIIPLCAHPSIRTQIICWDLRYDPAPLFELDAEKITTLLFTRKADLPEDSPHIALKTVHSNKCPVLAPLNVLREGNAERIQLDMQQCQRHAEQLQEASATLKSKLQQVFASHEFEASSDPDLMIYSGGFLSSQDKRQLEKVRRLSPQKLATASPDFADKRLPEMLFRYRARNYPETLNPTERARWEIYRSRRLTEADGSASLNYEQYQTELAQQQADSTLSKAKKQLLSDLKAYAEIIVNPV
ncbi:exodeoxyribonuclease I [Candidatus Venteria ishoeyi]|uniref:Exodeoxyribonuclease I n=1 Tax=Candidatus Venteria ishoeyi TaxID=1899563 RepID=A0A1H6FEZ2_9GAMM|nr:exodeoxyribonuclease I [Candidatus Venteria ishoeyi]SEH08587.1 Exodeoxyribonuclease I [Candidatus Venteria ishoeyi]